MINKRYKKIVVEIFDDIYNYEPADMKVTNICEIFICKLHEAFCSVRKSSIRFHDIIAADISNHKPKANSIQDFNDTENKELQELLKDPKEELNFIRVFIKIVVHTLKYANNNIPNIKDIYTRLGINNPETFMSSIDYASNNINNKDGFREGLNIFDALHTKGHEELAFIFIRFLSSKYKKEFIIDICKNYSQKEVLRYVKACKYFGETYKSIYKNRISELASLKNEISMDINALVKALKDYDIDKYFTNLYGLTGYETINYINKQKFIGNSKHKIFYVDIMSIVYYLIYQHPQYLVNWTFKLMLDKNSIQFRKSIFRALCDDTYAALFQYEYEWWQRKTGQTLDIPFPFSTEPFDKNNTTIVDYDLDDVKYNTNKFINQHETCEIGKNDEQSTKPTRDEIIKKLEKYFNTYEDDPVKGERFITDYLDDVIELSEDITDNYKSYGFAYILFHSKYFDWKKDKFNLKFVELIEPIFGIQIIERKGKYYPKDGLKKTKEILNIKKYKKLYGLLDDETKRRLKDKS